MLLLFSPTSQQTQKAKFLVNHQANNNLSGQEKYFEETVALGFSTNDGSPLAQLG